eukprot:6241982-Prymnesium_polylepis.3
MKRPTFLIQESTKRSHLPNTGRPTGDESVWFHIERRKRLRIILLLVGNIVFQIFLQIASCVYYSYQLDKSTPGVLLGLCFVLLSIGCAVCGAYWQTRYEHELHKAHPDRFPPNPVLHWVEKKQRERARKRAKKVCARERQAERVRVRERDRGRERVCTSAQTKCVSGGGGGQRGGVCVPFADPHTSLRL